MSTDKVQPTAKTVEKWHRLSLVSVIFNLARSIRQVIRQGLASLMPLIVLIVSADNKGDMTLYLGLAISASLIVSAILQYWFFRYRLVDNKLLVDEGVFKRQHRVMHFERIQNINIAQPFYFRPFALVVLMVETAGASTEEGNLAGISSRLANDIRDQILSRQNQLKISPNENVSQAQPPSGQVIATASIADLVRHGLANNGIYLFLALATAVYLQFYKALAQWLTPEKVEMILALFGEQMWQRVIIVLTLIIGVFAVFMFNVSFWFITSWLLPLLFYPLVVRRWHKYRFGMKDGYGVISSGFMGNKQVLFALFKVQRVEISQSLIQRRNHLATLVIYLASGRLTIPYMPIQLAQQWFDLLPR